MLLYYYAPWTFNLYNVNMHWELILGIGGTKPNVFTQSDWAHIMSNSTHVRGMDLSEVD